METLDPLVRIFVIGFLWAAAFGGMWASVAMIAKNPRDFIWPLALGVSFLSTILLGLLFVKELLS